MEMKKKKKNFDNYREIKERDFTKNSLEIRRRKKKKKYYSD